MESTSAPRDHERLSEVNLGSAAVTKGKRMTVVHWGGWVQDGGLGGFDRDVSRGHEGWGNRSDMDNWDGG